MEDKILLGTRKKFNYDIIDISGILSFSNSNRFKEYVYENISAASSGLVLNLQNVPHIDSSALSAFIELLRSMERSDGDMYLLHCNERVINLLRKADISRYFNILRDEQELSKRMNLEELDNLLSEPI